MNRDRWFLLAGAVASVIGDFILRILETDLTGLYFLPWIITGSILVAAKVGLAVFNEWLEEKSSRPASHARSARNNERIFRGRRQGKDFEDGDILLDVLAWGFFIAAPLALAGTGLTFAIAVVIRHKYEVMWVTLALAAVGWAFLALIYRITYGLHASLAISGDGVIFTGRRGDHAPRERVIIRWTDVADFTVVDSEETHGPWLVAVPPPKWPPSLHGPASRLYDKQNNRILICSLDDIGVRKDLVSGALDDKRPARRMNLHNGDI